MPMLMDSEVVPGFSLLSLCAITNSATLNIFVPVYCAGVPLRYISTSGIGGSQGMCTSHSTSSAKLSSKLVAPVYKVVEQKVGPCEDNCESSLSLGLVEQ